jgi:hypothetical protein
MNPISAFVFLTLTLISGFALLISQFFARRLYQQILNGRDATQLSSEEELEANKAYTERFEPTIWRKLELVAIFYCFPGVLLTQLFRRNWRLEVNIFQATAISMIFYTIVIPTLWFAIPPITTAIGDLRERVLMQDYQNQQRNREQPPVRLKENPQR